MAIGIMCFGSGSKENPEAKKSKEIEKQLREDQKRLAKEVKLLLLGMEYYKVAYWKGENADLSCKVPASLVNPQC